MRYRTADAGNGYMLEARIPARSAVLEGEIHVGEESRGIVLFAHGSGSSRHSRRNQLVAQSLRDAALATLLFDLLTREEEEAVDLATRHLRFDIGLPAFARSLGYGCLAGQGCVSAGSAHAIRRST